MPGNDIGRASLLIVPRFDNLTKTVNDALQRAGATASKRGQGLGESTTRGFGSGLAKSGALIGAFSSLTNAALSSISSHVGAAVSRFDTLNQYPRTMELLGYSSESAEASITKMSDRLSSLPTTLDSMTSTVQGIVAITGDLDQATDAGLALNDMLVASGSSAQLVGAAMEQFRQMLAKGRPEMEDWKSLTSAMPGQMAQLARAMLGPTATANDLYYALGGGGQDPTVTMDELMEAMIRLDVEGGEGITSFREQAETAAGGVQTAMANMGNAVTKGIASVMDEVGQDRISGVLNDLKAGINDAFGVAKDLIGAAVPAADDLYGAIKPMVPQILSFAGAFGVLDAAGGKVASMVRGISSNVKKLTPEMGLLAKANTLLGTSFDPVSLGIAGVSAVIGIAVTAWADYTERQENFADATRGLNDVVSDTAALEGYRGTVDGVGESAGLAAMSVDELAEATSKRVETMRENTESAEAEIAQLNTAQGIINRYAGATDLSADAQGRLQWALALVNDEFGLNISQADVAAGKYTDQDGKVQDLTASLNELIDAKKEEARVSAVTANLTEAYEAQSEAAATLAKAQGEYESVVRGYMEANEDMTRAEAEAAAENGYAAQQVASAEEQYRAACDAVDGYETQLGEAAAATSEAADEYDRLSATMGSAKFELFSAQLQGAGTSTAMLSEDLRALGADTEAFSALSEDRLRELAYSYDGTAGSIVGLLDEWGVSMDETAASNARAAESISAALSDLAGSSAVDLEALSGALAAAGVSTEQVRSIGSANIGALAEAVGGDVGAMTWAVQNWNQLPFLDKDGSVTVEDGSLVDAQGNVWTWNGSEFVSKTAKATVGGNLGTGLSQAERWMDLPHNLGDKVASVTTTITNVTRNITSHLVEGLGVRNAAGGIRLNAAGGIRAHASGAVIATRAVPLDIVGEDGAEAIVPLTNRRYSQPFVDLIAEGVDERSAEGSGETDLLLRRVVSLLSDIYEVIPEGMDRQTFGREVRKAVGYGY